MIPLAERQTADVAYDPMAGTLADNFARAQQGTKSGDGADFGHGPVPAIGSAQKIAPESFKSVDVNVVVLALDLGTRLGWAVRARDGKIWHGTEVFTPRKSWSPGQRWQRFRTFLHEVVLRHNVHVIAYEDVKRHVGTDAAHAYGAFLALTELVADSHRATLMPVGVKTIKKFWTGNGNADKDAMTAQAKVRGFRPETDNDSDALAILHYAVEKERAA